MSVPPNQTPRRDSQIRVVPYTPPRPRLSGEGGRGAEDEEKYGEDDRLYKTSTSVAQPYALQGAIDSSASYQTTESAWTTKTDEADARDKGPSQGYALSSPTTSSLLLAKRGNEGVSGHQLATGTSGERPAVPAVTPALAPSSNVPSIPVINAPPAQSDSASASYFDNASQAGQSGQSGQSSRFPASSRQSQYSDAEPSSSTAAPVPSPQSRRRSNFVAVLNEDKTFSLVPLRKTSRGRTQSRQQDTRASSSLSDYSGPGGSGTASPALPFYPSTPNRASQSSSHGGRSSFTSYASSREDRPSSSLTSTGTIPDRSITPYTPTPSSPAGSESTVHLTEDPIATAASPWNYRLVGGLRKVPKTPDLREKPSSNSTASDDNLTLTPVPERAFSPTPAAGVDDSQLETLSVEEEEGDQASYHSLSATPSTGSDKTNYRVYRHDSEAPQEAQSFAGEDEEQADDTQLIVNPKASFQSGQSGQSVETTFESSNYKIYGRSSSEESSDRELGPPATILPAASEHDSGSQLDIPALQQQASFGSVRSNQTSAAGSETINYRIHGHSPTLLPIVPETDTLSDTQPPLEPKSSFLSAASTTSATTNYKVYGHSSPAAQASIDSFRSFNPPSPCGTDAPLLRSESRTPSINTQGETGNADADNSNYILHGESSPDQSPDPSPPGSAPGYALRHPHAAYSRESLVIPPLQSQRLSSKESFGYYAQRSRDKLRSKKSLRSISSVSSLNSDSTENYLAGQAFLSRPPGQFEPAVTAGPSDRQLQLEQQRQQEQQRREEQALWAAGAAALASGSGGQMQQPLPTTPHQWSSQLSTVMSESEPGSSEGGSGSGSTRRSMGTPGSGGRHSSRGWGHSSSHSRQMLSISSSLAAELEQQQTRSSRSNSGTGSFPERPSPVAHNGRFHQGTVRDQDEHGDGLADLHSVTPRPSRTGLSGFFNSSNSSDRNLHSSASSRSDTTFNPSAIPTWAKVYYGSGERRWMRSLSMSTTNSSSNRLSSSMSSHGGSGPSPSTDHFPLSIYSPRRRPHEVQQGPSDESRWMANRGSMEIQPAAPQEDYHIPRRIRRITSSLWSPHLRRDVRATEYSMWDPPSVAWSAESGMFGRRNIQVVLFTAGFIFPFAWMIGAVLPLPAPSPLTMVERYNNSQVEIGAFHEYERHIETVDEVRYQSAKWWRTLNRCMSVIGLLIIGAVVGLVIASIKQGWGTST